MLRRIKRALGLTMNRKLASRRGEQMYQTGSNEVEFRGNKGTTAMTVDTFERIARLGACLDAGESFTVEDDISGEIVVRGAGETSGFALKVSADGEFEDSRNRVNLTQEVIDRGLERIDKDAEGWDFFDAADHFEPTEVADYKGDHLWQTSEETFEFRGNRGTNVLTLENLETIDRLAPCGARGDEFTVSNDHGTTLVVVKTSSTSRYDYKVSLYTKRSGSPTSSDYDAKVHTVSDAIRDGIEAAGGDSGFAEREVSSTIGEHAYLVDETTVEFRGNKGNNRMAVETVERLSRLGPCMDVGDTMVLSDDEGDHYIERVDRGDEMYEIGLDAPYGEVDPDDGKVRITEESVSNILDAAE